MQDKFVVPQFIENEARVFGPITVRQFLIILFAGFLIFVAYKLSDFALSKHLGKNQTYKTDVKCDFWFVIFIESWNGAAAF